MSATSITPRIQLQDFMQNHWSLESIQILSISILAYLVVLVSIAGVIMWRKQSAVGNITTIIVVVSIVGVSSVLLIAGYSSEQLTPVIGLFGAIVGYVLGKDSSLK